MFAIFQQLFAPLPRIRKNVDIRNPLAEYVHSDNQETYAHGSQHHRKYARYDMWEYFRKWQNSEKWQQDCIKRVSKGQIGYEKQSDRTFMERFRNWGRKTLNDISCAEGFRRTGQNGWISEPGFVCEKSPKVNRFSQVVTTQSDMHRHRTHNKPISSLVFQPRPVSLNTVKVSPQPKWPRLNLSRKPSVPRIPFASHSTHHPNFHSSP